MEPNEEIYIIASKGDFDMTLRGPKAEKVYNYILSLLDISDKKFANKPESLTTDISQPLDTVKEGYLGKV